MFIIYIRGKVNKEGNKYNLMGKVNKERKETSTTLNVGVSPVSGLFIVCDAINNV